MNLNTQKHAHVQSCVTVEHAVTPYLYEVSQLLQSGGKSQQTNAGIPIFDKYYENLRLRDNRPFQMKY